MRWKKKSNIVKLLWNILYKNGEQKIYIKLNKKNYENILIYDISCKTLIGTKPYISYISIAY